MSDQPIIIKRIKKGGHGAHGGSWKVAYADFMTAMMAFFLLLWLLNSVTEEQLLGISNYFAPTAVSSSPSGAGGVLGGQVLGEGAMQSDKSDAMTDQLALPPPTIGTGGSSFTDDAEGSASEYFDQKQDAATRTADASSSARDKATMGLEGAEGSAESSEERIAEELQKDAFDRQAEEMRRVIDNTPELAAISQNLVIDSTPEGLRLQLVDQEGLSMFDRGSARLLPHTQKLLESVLQIFAEVPNKVAIVGHTDSTPYSGSAQYGNWELSADRANATRRALVQKGLDPARIQRVEGRADQEPYVPEDPGNAKNRRIEITLLRDPSLFMDQARALSKGEKVPGAGQGSATGKKPGTPSPGASGTGGAASPSADGESGDTSEDDETTQPGALTPGPAGPPGLPRFLNTPRGGGN
ncbi:OmpA family protein [Phaeovibrio sulfidiphilus]|uniref:OmpA family protein n=1 Tax=Phaeovibrio sulfidiphilus TaxID=1220600 RepID=A0A8J6YN07_9PROT|nr:flagellar motor protein MotB [Phaeovibrio sulfidiphilus]MBE1237645.1 OmpA family protein [Phaeovibrio sulfidiphilus]